MATVEVQGVEGMQALVGQEIGPSEWRTVTQADIDTFAELSGDDQWIHVDVERAKKREPVRHHDRPRQPHALPGRRLPQAS